MFESLALWVDGSPGSGPRNMAVDEWLLETAGGPLLRVYGWGGSWGSFGYSGSHAEAQSRLDGVDWVRRPTGGGVVDHRADWTYTLVVPAEHPLSLRRGPWAYRVIHSALAMVLREEGHQASMTRESTALSSPDCFACAVEHDLVAPDGTKLAGAGQRRTARGLLHQGSVALPCDDHRSHRRAEALAHALAKQVDLTAIKPCPDRIPELVSQRYGNENWTRTRRSG